MIRTALQDLLIMRVLRCLLFLAAALPCTAAGNDAVLWQPPRKITVDDWIWGPGGKRLAPKGPFEFLEEDLHGAEPKIRVLDANRLHWTVKFGRESHSEVFAARMLFALGYEAQAVYFVRSGVVTEVQGLKRAKPFLRNNGEFADARFKLREGRKVTRVEGLQWSWTSNPFLGTHQLNGLKILMMLMSNWDGKAGSTAVYAKHGSNGDVLHYAFDDWGATFGKWGGLFSRDRWDSQGYREQSRSFVVADGATILWGYRGKQASDLTRGVGIDDVRWLLTYLNGVTDKQLRAGPGASGATPAEVETYTRAIRQRIAQLQRLCGCELATN